MNECTAISLSAWHTVAVTYILASVIVAQTLNSQHTQFMRILGACVYFRGRKTGIELTFYTSAVK